MHISFPWLVVSCHVWGMTPVLFLRICIFIKFLFYLKILRFHKDSYYNWFRATPIKVKWKRLPDCLAPVCMSALIFCQLEQSTCFQPPANSDGPDQLNRQEIQIKNMYYKRTPKYKKQKYETKRIQMFHKTFFQGPFPKSW